MPKTRDTAQGYIECMPLHIGDAVVWTDGRSCDYYITTKISWLDRLPNLLSNVWFQKISIPPPRKVTGNSEGEGGLKAEISEGSGGFTGISFSRG